MAASKAPPSAFIAATKISAKVRKMARHATMGQTPPPLPNPATPPPLSPIISANIAQATQGGATHSNVRKSSDQRFRSFAERYVVARAHLLTNDPQRLAEEQYAMVLDAKRFYAMIERAGQNIQPEDGVF